MTVFSVSFPLHFPPVFFPPRHIFVPFLPKREYLSSSDVSSLSHPSHSNLGQRGPKLCTELCTYLLWKCTTYTSGEVQHMRSFSGLTAAFVSHCIWSKYVSAPVEKIKTPHTTTSEKQKATRTGRQNNFQWERLGEWFLLRVLQPVVLLFPFPRATPNGMWLRLHLPVCVDTVSSYYLLALCEPVLAYTPGSGIEVSKRDSRTPLRLLVGYCRSWACSGSRGREQAKRHMEKTDVKYLKKYTGMLNGEERVIPKESVRRRSPCAVSRGM